MQRRDVVGYRVTSVPTRLIGAGVCALMANFLGACDGNPIGPCVHEYREALLQVVGARDAQDNTPLPNFVIRQVQIDGREQDLRFVVAGPSYGVELKGDSLVCRVPCGFGTQEGNYIFTVSAPGYPPQVRGYEGRYGVFHGGCPSYNDAGVRVTLRLSRA